MAEGPWIEDLRRRLHQDPASIAFAQLGEELRRAGEYQDAVDVCAAGLSRYPGYTSARVTLARALTGLQRFDEARRELDRVLAAAPGHPAASRASAELAARTSPVASSDAGAGSEESSETSDPRRQAGRVDAAEYPRLVRTLSALQEWLEALHVASPERRA